MNFPPTQNVLFSIFRTLFRTFPVTVNLSLGVTLYEQNNIIKSERAVFDCKGADHSGADHVCFDRIRQNERGSQNIVKLEKYVCSKSNY